MLLHLSARSLPGKGYISFPFFAEHQGELHVQMFLSQNSHLICSGASAWGNLHSVYLLTDRSAAGCCLSSLSCFCSLVGLEHLLDQGHWSQKLKVKICLWQWKHALILRFNNYLGLCASSVFCLSIVCRVFMKGNQEGDEDCNAQIFREWWYKGWDCGNRTALSHIKHDKLHQHNDARQKQVSSRKGMSFQLCHKFTFGWHSQLSESRENFILTLMEYKHSGFNL